MRCKDCRYWQKPEDEEVLFGECRRRAPVFSDEYTYRISGMYWCGEWEGKRSDGATDVIAPWTPPELGED